MTQVTVLNPKVIEEVNAVTPAVRLKGLKGVKVGFVDNSKMNADMFIRRIGEKLTDQYGIEIGAVVRKLAPKDTLPSDEIDMLSGCEAVIQCFGDCGTSTSMTVADAVTLEGKGKPTASIFSTAFSGAARQQAMGRGLSTLPLVEIPHPMHSASKDQVIERADAVVDAIAQTLTSDNFVSAEVARPISDEKISIEEAQADDQEFFFEQGWTDGLPVVSPTLEKVTAALSTVNRDPKEIVGIVPPRHRPATVEKIAINAVMAGCKPEYFPAVLAATEGMIEDDAKLYGAQTATNMSTPLLILNGPISHALGANSGRNVFGSGNRPNATIGRAVRLVCRNIGGEIPDETDVATHGQPGKYTYCFAENEDESPWSPFHTDYGFKANESAVSVVGGASSPHNVFTYGCEHGEEVLEHFIGAVTALGNNNIIFASGPLLVFSPEHAFMLDRDGFSKDDIRNYIFEKGRIPLTRFVEKTVKGLHHRRSNWFETVGDPDHIGVADQAEDIMIAVAGGAGIHSLFIPTSFSLRPVVKAIPTA
ncbi:MAG: hypothetical protein HOF30_02435 [Rhodospirillaceae bacterium]|jgi:hypothetical protein|nr:hypothetical protein [Rhodospirillaceae bacterium]MBT5033658.1 hypothetical protein [Rhodospirillaceae bacterium]